MRTQKRFGTGRAIQYRVAGLPANEVALTANFGSFLHGKWKTLRVKDGVGTRWEGSYAGADDALISLS